MIAATLLGLCLAGVAASAAPAEVPMPRPRPAEAADPVGVPPLPPARPAVPSAALQPEVSGPGPAPVVYRTACPVVLSGAVTATVLPPIDDGLCHVRSPLAATAILAGGRRIAFSSPAIVGCALATQLAEWVRRVDAYAEVVLKSPVAEILVGTSYECRPRNHTTDARLSEHAFADAADISGFRLADGTVLAPAQDWAGDGPAARAMRYAHDAACGLFTTVLGPDANALHADHLHVDLGCHGQSCTYRICE